MMKKVLLTTIVHCCILTYAQVGIETAYPKGIFHIDGNKDNPKDGTALSAAQQANDFIVLQKTGQVGIGTTTPTTNLEINNGTVNGAIKIVDGNQGAGKYLMSDATGLATWKTPNSFKSAIAWIYDGTPKVVSNLTPTFDTSGRYLQSSDRIATNLSISGLTRGKWIVNVGLRLDTPAPVAKAFWIHGNLSVSPSGQDTTGFTNLGPAGNATGYASNIYGDGTTNGKGFFSGTTIISVTSTTPISLYFLIEPTGVWSFNTSSPENYFYAIPIN